MAMMQSSDASGIFRRNRHYHMMPVPPFIMQAGMKQAQIPPKGQTSCYNFFKGSRKTGKGMPDQEGTSSVTVQNRF